MLIAGTSLTVFYLWNKWTYHQAHKSFVFSEMNVLNLGNYQSILINPVSFESNFFFYLNFPGLVYASFLIERGMGSRFLLAAYLANCLLAAGTTVVVHRQIGFRKV